MGEDEERKKGENRKGSAFERKLQKLTETQRKLLHEHKRVSLRNDSKMNDEYKLNVSIPEAKGIFVLSNERVEYSVWKISVVSLTKMFASLISS